MFFFVLIHWYSALKDNHIARARLTGFLLRLVSLLGYKSPEL
jgi:hypothetical protein